MVKFFKEIWDPLQKNEKRYLISGLWIILAIGTIIIFVLPFVFTRPVPFEWMSSSDESNVADTINGIASPFIALLVAILTFLAFYVQYRANIQQRQQFLREVKEQARSSRENEITWKTERFENRFYELLKLHRSNVDVMNIADRIKGRKCFIHMFDELRMIYNHAKEFSEITSPKERHEFNYTEINLLSFSYSIFFFGIGVQSEKHFRKSLAIGEDHLFKQPKPFFQKVQDKALVELKQSRNYIYGLPLTQIPDDRTFEFYYYPFDGHVNRLGHYFRHLFQTAKYVVDAEFLSDNQKYGYIKTLRAQLSNFEQLMLYYNALAWFPKEWHLLFTNFRLIKNLPLTLADFHQKPEDLFKDDIERLRKEGIAMFDWHE